MVKATGQFLKRTTKKETLFLWNDNSATAILTKFQDSFALLLLQNTLHKRQPQQSFHMQQPTNWRQLATSNVTGRHRGPKRCNVFSSSHVVLRAFSALCMHSKFGYHTCAKVCFFHGLHCWASPWRKIAYSTHPINQSLTQLIWCAGNWSFRFGINKKKINKQTDSSETEYNTIHLALVYQCCPEIRTVRRSFFAGFPLSCLEKIQDFFRTFQDPKMLLTSCSILHVCYWTYCIWRHPRPTHLTKCTVHKDAISRCITYEMPNISKFIVTLFQ